MIDVSSTPIVGSEYPLGFTGPAPDSFGKGLTFFKGSKVSKGPKYLIPSQGYTESDTRKLYQAVTANEGVMLETISQIKSFTNLLLKTPSFKQNLVAEDKSEDPYFLSVLSFNSRQMLSLGKRVGVDIDRDALLKIAGLTQDDITTAMKNMATYHTLIKAGSSDIDTLTKVSEAMKDDYKKLLNGFIVYAKHLNSELGTTCVGLYMYDLCDKSLANTSMKDDFVAYPSRMTFVVFKKGNVPDIALTIYPMEAFTGNYKVAGNFGIIVDVFYYYTSSLFSGYRIERDGKVY